VNRAYIGQVFFRDSYSPGLHAPIVEALEFERAQRLIAERGEDASRRRGNTSEFVLSGTILCERCGRRFVGVTANGNGGSYRYYTCASRAKLGKKVCDQERLPASDLERDVIAHVIACLKDSALLNQSAEQLSQRAAAAQPDYDQELAAVQRKTREAQTAIDRYLRAFETGTLTAEVCGGRVLELRAQLTALENRREELEAAIDEHAATPSLKDVRMTASRLAKALMRGDTPKRKALLRKILQIRVESRQRILPTIFLPMVRTMGDWVGPPGLEPGIDGLRASVLRHSTCGFAEAVPCLSLVGARYQLVPMIAERPQRRVREAAASHGEQISGTARYDLGIWRLSDLDSSVSDKTG
jgi:site-specific DNA recombinase